MPCSTARGFLVQLVQVVYLLYLALYCLALVLRHVIYALQRLKVIESALQLVMLSASLCRLENLQIAVCSPLYFSKRYSCYANSYKASPPVSMEKLLNEAGVWAEPFCCETDLIAHGLCYLQS